MDTRSFLMGLFYSAIVIDDSYKSDSMLITQRIKTNDSLDVVFAINRGICPIDGCVSYAFTNPDNSLFDIRKDWVDYKVWEFILDRGFKTSECDPTEVRIGLHGIIDIIDKFGGVIMYKDRYEK